MLEAGISLGSNLGNRLHNLQRARHALEHMSGACLEAASPVYETDPVDVPPEYASQTFLNAVAILRFDLPVRRLVADLHALEDSLGRVRTGKRNAPRVVDLDLIFAGDLLIDEPGLRVPHPRWHERRFVVQPLADLRPDSVLPGQSRTVRQILLSLPDQPKATMFAQDWKAD